MTEATRAVLRQGVEKPDPTYLLECLNEAIRVYWASMNRCRKNGLTDYAERDRNQLKLLLRLRRNARPDVLWRGVWS